MATHRDKTVDYVEFPSTDLPATQRFYEQVFGWSFESYGPDYMSFSDGRVAGGFYRIEAVTTIHGGPLVVIFVEDLPGTERRIKEAGGVITKETFSFPGGSRFHFRDPGGNQLSAGHY